jgi:hypothetical protein
MRVIPGMTGACGNSPNRWARKRSSRSRGASCQTEEIQIERREQHLGGHEAVGDPGDVADVVQRLGQ